ncbi:MULTISPECIES: HepT-like ribonuclease domain-containing protein [Mumia]|uniref:HepT-like ribonuclease domain-containing protein n=1 Tax=Mumia TaxID=1546255 RepID=UPI0014228FBE|nr:MULTISPECIES: HepT-like ribonuclease domain-containing protein [unclassified Mumia]QMW65851.1 DUF86 domain-containing protein [Mumia sp. ZJ1417]
MTRAPSERIRNALSHVAILRQHLERGPIDDLLIFDAVCQRLAASIEEVMALPEELVIAEFGARWRGIRATRNALAHNYRFVDHLAVRQTVSDNLDDFEQGLRRLQVTIAAGGG